MDSSTLMVVGGVAFARRVLIAVGLLALLATGVGAESGRFGGIGAKVVPTVTGELVVLGVVAGSPADRGGLRPGDMIVEVDDFVLRGSDFHQVVMGKLWGEAGSSVRLRYLRPGKLWRQQVKLKRVELQTGNDDHSLPGVQLLTPETEEKTEKGQ